MKSGKQKKAEIKKSRLARIGKRDTTVDPYKYPIPEWAIPVDRSAIVYHSMYLDIPLFYIDKEFQCKDCGSSEVWTAKQQKWWYEIAKGYFETTAIRCRSCRDRRKKMRVEKKRHMEEMAKKVPHPNSAFFKNT
ncbi:zinc-ribbon domain-containing protein [Litoribacillus peritrichatus]|uniref:Probable zinc-binding domain-containing protein n=1 Tax=Litoribacillus peritrichatus TaxID=718191 RepID=A0ABP7M9V6_9GAMM